MRNGLLGLCGCGRGRSAAEENQRDGDGDVAYDELDSACRGCSSGSAASKVKVSLRERVEHQLSLPFEHWVYLLAASWFTFHPLTYCIDDHHLAFAASLIRDY